MSKNQPLMAIDSLGRRLPDPSQESTMNSNKLTGMFYFLWHETRDYPIYDISKIVAADPEAGYHGDSEEWGQIADFHFWGEPFYGYYTLLDEWVVRKHMKMIIQAGIDFLFFDTTNNLIYEPQAKLVLKVLEEYYQDGFAIPKVMFYTNTDSGQRVQEIYEAIYKTEYCRDTWFCLDGKPVIIAIEEQCSQETRAFFTIKKAQWPNEPDKVGGWPWMDFTKPQRIFVDESGAKETINVSVAQHPQLRFGDSVLYGETTNCGRGWHYGANDPDPEGYIHGYNLEEQFERALEADTPIVLITGWNEWIAGRWQGIPERPIMFVDCANYEYSRDIEMMRGGYFDNFYMQLCSYVRKIKGSQGVRIYLEGEEAVYENFSDGLFSRDGASSCSKEPNYINKTQRNAIQRVKVLRKGDELLFTIETKDPIGSDRSGSFLNLFLSLGKEAGFDYVVKEEGLHQIHHAPAESSSRRLCDQLTDTTRLCDVPMTVTDRTCTIPLSLQTLGLPQEHFELWFKAADSTLVYENVENFYENGDVAPLGRAAYIYRG